MKYPMWVLGFLFNTLSLFAHAQSGSVGLPFIQNFAPKEYNSHTQNWAIVQDKRGVMYFGNNNGVLEYDGVSWRLIPVSNNSVVRSLAIDSAGTIFVGAVGEFGYLAPDSEGNLQYQSLLEELGDVGATFSDVWSTLTKGEEVYFHTRHWLFRYENGQIKKWKLRDAYHRSFLVYNKLYLRQEGLGLMVLEGDSLLKVGGGSLFEREVISAMIPFKGKLLIGSRSRGLFIYDPQVDSIYPFQAEANKILSESLIYHGIKLADGSIAFATIKDGIIVINEAGKNTVHLHERTGLQQSLTLYLFADFYGTLWAGLAKGISKVEINLPFQLYHEILGLTGGINAVTRHNGTLFVATHQGVYFLNNESHFEKVEGLDAQCWNFLNFSIPSEPDRKKLLVASSTGVHEIEAGKFTPVIKGLAYQLHKSDTDPSRVFVSFEGGIGSLRYSNKQWLEEGRLEIANDGFRSMGEDGSGNLWVGSMFSGTFRLKLSDWEAYIAGRKEHMLDAVENYGIAEGLPTTNWNAFFRIGNKPVVASQKGIYSYNPVINAFEKDSVLNKPFNQQERWIYFLSEDEKGNVWFDSEKGKGVLLKEEKGYKLSEYLLKRISTSQENVVGIYNEGNGIVWFGTPDGLFHYDSNRKISKKEAFQSLIRKVILGEDSVIYYGSNPKLLAANKEKKQTNIGSLHQSGSFHPKMSYSDNSLSFHFAAPAYHLEGSNKFSYFLEGYDEQWSGWTRETKKEYTNLPEGKYIFNVKAKNLYEIQGLPASFAFTVLPPWYRTKQAYAAYLLTFVLAFVGVSRLYGHKLKKDNERLELVIKNRTAEIENQKKQIEISYQHLTTLSQVGQKITASLDSTSITHTLYQSMETLMNASSFGVGVFDKQSQVLHIENAYENRKKLPAFDLSVSRKDTLAVWCFNNKKEVFINDVKKEIRNYLSEIPASPPEGKRFFESVIYVPLQLQEKVIGVIMVQSFSKNAYQPHHLDIMRTLAAYTAIALDNSQAYLRVNEINEELSTTLKHLKQTQTQLVQSEKMASLGQLTAGVAHEINNPINFVSAGIDSLGANYNDLQGFLQKLSGLKEGEDNTALLQEVEKLKKEIELDYLMEEIPQLLKSIKTGAQRTTEIVKSLKNFTRLDEDNLKQANLHEGLDSTLVILRNQLNENIKIVKNYDASVPSIYCFPGQLNQVFMNILNNAIHALGEKGELHISTSLQQEHVLIRIKDTGKGMSQEIKDRIFEPFFTTKDVGEGTGLGLSISYSIIEKHKGKIEVESIPGKGTEFIIFLPVNLN